MLDFLYYWTYYLSLGLVGVFSTALFIGLGELLDSVACHVVSPREQYVVPKGRCDEVRSTSEKED